MRAAASWLMCSVLAACGARTEPLGPASPPVPDPAADAAAPAAAARRMLASTECSSCVLRSGAVYCWGCSQGYPTRSDDTQEDAALPARVLGIDDAVSVSAAVHGIPPANETCVLRRSGRVSCWNGNGLGDGAHGRSRPSDVGIDDARQVVVASGESCALRASGRVSCWSGRPEPHGWGWDDPFGSPHVEDVPGIEDAVQIAGTGLTMCALRESGIVSCWGDGTAGALGDGVDARLICDHCTVTPVDVVGVTDAVEISARCARRASGAVVCWGALVGDGTTEVHTAVEVPLLRDARGIADRCAVLADGTPVCWGWRTLGQVGDGRYAHERVPTPTPVAGVHDVVEVASSSSQQIFHVRACARSGDGTVWCWGRSGAGPFVHGREYGLGDGIEHDVCEDGTACSPLPVRALLP